MGSKHSIEYVSTPSNDTIGITAAKARPSLERDSFVISSHSMPDDDDIPANLPIKDVDKKGSECNDNGKPLVLKSVHLSSISHPYCGENHDYAGFILYAHDGETKWTLNDRNCEIGLLIIKDTGKEEVKRHIDNSEGMVHGAVYKSVFDEDVGNTVGEGFSVRKGTFEWNSRTFNARDDTYHDDRRTISDVAKQCVSKVLKRWMKAGEEGQRLPSQRRYTVKELLHDN